MGCSGQLSMLLPLMLERLGPGGALLIVELPIGRDRTHDMPAVTAAECEQTVGGIPTIEEPIDVEPWG